MEVERQVGSCKTRGKPPTIRASSTKVGCSACWLANMADFAIKRLNMSDDSVSSRSRSHRLSEDGTPVLLDV
jgi:hypothetical protein